MMHLPTLRIPTSFRGGPGRAILPAVLAAALALALPRGAPGEVRALALEVEGKVTVLESGGRGDAPPEPRSPHSLDILGDGSQVRLAKGQRIELLCSTEHLVVLEGPARWRVDAEGCGEGRRQPTGTFRGLLPRRGRLVEVVDVLALEMTTRGEEDEEIPAVLAPRNTALREPPTHLVWRAIPEALEYRVQILGPAPVGSRNVAVEPPEADCGIPRADWPGLSVCALPWSRFGVEAIPADGLYLSVGVRFAPGAPLRKERRAPKVWPLAASARQTLEERLHRWPAPGAKSRVGAVPEIRLLLEAELYEAARQRLLGVLAATEAPVLRVTLGDLYLEIGLPQQAVEQYQRALQGGAPAAAGAAAGAAAHFGLGRVHFHQDEYAAAQEDFARARELFARAGLERERQAAQAAATEAAERSQER